MRMSNRAGLISALVLLVLLILRRRSRQRSIWRSRSVPKCSLFAMAAMAVNLLIGYTGVLPFGNAAFFGLGAYGAGLTIQFWHAKFFSSIALGVLAAIVGTLLIGPFLLRRRGIYFSLLFIAFGQVFYFLAYKFTDMTGGEDGMNFARPVIEGRTSRRTTRRSTI